MLILLREAIFSLIQRRVIFIHIILIAALNLINYYFNDNIQRLTIWCFEYFILVSIYVTILGNEKTSFKDNAKSALKILPRFTGLFICFGIIVSLLVVIENILLKEVIYYENGILDYVNIVLISTAFSPLFLYAPIFLINKNAFVYESIREGYKFLVLKPVSHSMLSIILTAISLFKYQAGSDHYIILFMNQFVFISVIFFAINLSYNIFQRESINYVSLKDKIEKDLIMKRKKGFFGIYRGKWED